MTLFNGKKYNDRHGGPFDRGSADSYYGRPKRPHYFVGPTHQSEEKAEYEMSAKQIAAYLAGYAYSDWYGDKKSW